MWLHNLVWGRMYMKYHYPFAVDTEEDYLGTKLPKHSKRKELSEVHLKSNIKENMTEGQTSITNTRLDYTSLYSIPKVSVFIFRARVQNMHKHNVMSVSIESYFLGIHNVLVYFPLAQDAHWTV